MIMDEQSLAEFAEYFKSGERTAFESIYKAAVKDVFFIALKYTKNRDQALDITQNTFVNIHKSIDELKDTNTFQTWLYCIVYNLCQQTLGKREDVTVDHNDNLVFPELVNESPDIGGGLIPKILDSLPSRQFISIILFFYYQKSVIEISTIMNCSTIIIKSLLNNARKEIRKKTDQLKKKGVSVPAFIPMLTGSLQDSYAESQLSDQESLTIWNNINNSLRRPGIINSFNSSGRQAASKITSAMSCLLPVRYAALTAPTMAVLLILCVCLGYIFLSWPNADNEPEPLTTTSLSGLQMNELSSQLLSDDIHMTQSGPAQLSKAPIQANTEAMYTLADKANETPSIIPAESYTDAPAESSNLTAAASEPAPTQNNAAKPVNSLPSITAPSLAPEAKPADGMEIPVIAVDPTPTTRQTISDEYKYPLTITPKPTPVPTNTIEPSPVPAITAVHTPAPPISAEAAPLPTAAAEPASPPEGFSQPLPPQPNRASTTEIISSSSLYVLP